MRLFVFLISMKIVSFNLSFCKSSIVNYILILNKIKGMIEINQKFLIILIKLSFYILTFYFLILGFLFIQFS